ncbi:uncharacterized protein LOC142982368 [Anticarsia gemmatalis]|uniref:uncharacterized protein LOC142982368 n=1 Tax=Anticarsia gemmatalis TaxID=129554 RepID=UPI003F762B3A
MRSLVVFLSLLCYSQSYKILVCYPLPVKSLNILGEGVVRHLLNDGHEVTFITTHPLKNPPTKNFRQIDISVLGEVFDNDERLSIDYVLNNQIQGNDAYEVQEYARIIADLTFKNENITKFLENPNEHFDAVIVDLFESEVYAGFSVLYNCPMIWLYSMGAHWQVVRLISDTANPAYDPDYLLTNMPPFTFWQRIQELRARLEWAFFKTFYTKPLERGIYEQAFGPAVRQRGRELPEYEEVIFNSSLIFGNEHNAIFKRPLTPQNFKYIGGFHIEDPVKPLPKDLQDLMDNAPHGVIYFSMGSLWKSKGLPMELTRGILNVFGELKQTVIWKYEDDLKDLPKNVKLVNWAPQPSILAHPNCKFFITHGGLLSSIEAMHFGVPIIGIPVQFDQFANVKKAVSHGYALNVDLNWDLPKNLKVAIKEMLSNENYRKNAKELSFIYHDRPVKPGAELTHWVRHVIRTGGAPHMRSPALNVPLYQRLYLDLAALIIGVFYILKKSLSSLMKKNKNVSKKKKHYDIMRSLVVFLSFLCYSQAYKILVCYPLPVKSLNILGEGVVRHLLSDGHEVTFMTTHPLKNPPTKNFRQIDISAIGEEFYKDETLSISYVIKNKVQENHVLQTQEYARANAEQAFKNENITNFINDPNEHFDAVIVDLFESEVYAGFSVLYNCPMIWLYSMGTHWQVVRLISDTASPAYDPDYCLSNIPPFNFAQRIHELWIRIVWNFCKMFITQPSERGIYEQTFGPAVRQRGRELPAYEEVIFNASLIFGNEHNAIAKRPMTPQNFKYIGGFHIEEPVRPLPKDLQELMDNAPHGVIYFSMGSFWKSKGLPMELTRAILNVFGELKQTVIWKYEDELKDLPKNVKIVKWAPQQSILAHPNCKFFITHGGLLSSIEAVHFGVPIIGIPVLFDQFTNVKKALSHGYALEVDLNWDLPKNLRVAINEMLRNEIYKKKAKELSFIYHDRPVKPGAELAHWVRHVIRTGGAPHMRSPALNVPLYQRLYLDLAALIIGIYYILKKSLSSLMQKNKNVSKKKKQ